MKVTCKYTYCNENSNENFKKCIVPDCTAGVHESCVNLRRNNNDYCNELFFMCQDCQDYLKIEVKDQSSIVVALFMSLRQEMRNFKNSTDKIEKLAKDYDKIANECSSNYVKVTESVDSLLVNTETQEKDKAEIKNSVLNVNRQLTKFCEKQDEIRDIVDKAVNKQKVVKDPIYKDSEMQTERQNLMLTTEEVIGGWRMLGDRKVWKNDWSYYDEKQRRRKIEEKKQAKRIKLQKQKRKQLRNKNKLNFKQRMNNQFTHNTDPNLLKNANVMNFNQTNQNHSNLIDVSAKNQFPNNKKPNYKNFVQGETLNPVNSFETSKIVDLNDSDCSSLSDESSIIEDLEQRKSISNSIKVVPVSNSNSESDKNENSNTNIDSCTALNPLFPPVVRLTQNCANGQYQKARFRDEKIRNVVRLYLAYLFNQSESVVVDKMTVVSAKISIASEGLPTEYDKLLKLYCDFNEEFGVSSKQAQADLDAYRASIRTQRLNNIQKSRENSHNFFKSNF